MNSISRKWLIRFYYLITVLMIMFSIWKPAVQSILIGLFCLFTILIFNKNFPDLIRNKYRYISFLLMTSYYLWSLFSFFWSENKQSFLKEIQPNLVLLIIPFIFLFFITDINKNIKKIMGIFFILSSLIYITLWFNYVVEGISLYQVNVQHVDPIRNLTFLEQVQYLIQKTYRAWVAGISELGQKKYGSNKLFFHPVYISAFLLCVLIQIILVFKEIQNILVRILLIFAGLFITYFVLYLDSKINIALLPVILVYLIFQFPIRLRYLFVVALVPLIIYKLNNINSRIESAKNTKVLQKEYSISEDGYVIDYQRYLIYSRILEVVKDNLIFGIGLGDTEDTINQSIPLNEHIQRISIEYPSYNAHSQFLHYLLASGLIGLILFLAMFTYNIYIGIISKNWSFIIIILIVFTNCLFENYLGRVWGALTFISTWIMMFPLNPNVEKIDVNNDRIIID